MIFQFLCGVAVDDEEIKEKQTEKVRLGQEETRQDLGRVSSGVQGNKIERGFVKSQHAYGSNSKTNKDADSDLAPLWLQKFSADYQKLVMSYMKFSGTAHKFYDDSLNEIAEIRADFEDMKADLQSRTIQLDDGRSVYIDESGNYVYQNNQGEWQALEEGALEEARRKHAAIGPNAGMKADKTKLDEFEHQLNDTERLIRQNKQDLAGNDQKARDGDLTQDDVDRAKQQYEDAQEKIDHLRSNKITLTKELTTNKEARTSLEETDKSLDTDISFDDDIFENDAGNQTRHNITAAGPAIETDIKMSHDFTVASQGITKEPEPAQTPQIPDPTPQQTLG